MEERERIRWVLDEAAVILCTDLDPAKIIRMMKSKHVLDDGDEAEIKSETRLDDRVDRMLAILKRKPPIAYREFMDALCKDREDLYSDVKAIEEKINYGKKSSIMEAPLGDMFTFIPRSDVTIQQPLGNGGFGRVHLGTHNLWGTVAVKRFERVVLTDHIRKEAEKMVRAIRSSYIVRIMGLMEESTSLSIVMEYVENGNLKNFQRKYMDCDCWARKVKMLLDISFGMNYLHTLQPPIYHLDLKLENVFVGNGFEAKIGDLGLAMTETSAQCYQVAAAQGTASHIPPEGWDTSTKTPDKFWDIFMFAITSFELLSGKDPWPKYAKPVQISVWVKTNKRPDLSQIPVEAPRDLIDIMKHCWKSRSTDRPQFQEIKDRISGIYQARYEMDINAANIAIRQRIREVDASAEHEDTSSSQCSGFSTQKKGVKQMGTSIGSTPATREKDDEKGSSSEFHTHLARGQAALTEAHSVPWRIVKEFGKEGDGQGEFKLARGIAVCSNNDIVVVDKTHYRVYLYSEFGRYKFTLVSPKSNPKAKLVCPWDVAVTSQGHIAVVEATLNPDESKYVKVFNVNGKYLHSFSTVAKDKPYTKIASNSITVAADGKILVGDILRKCVTIHAGSDGGLIQKVDLTIQPYYLATNSHCHIIACDWQASKVIAVNHAGKRLFTLDSFRLDGGKGVPEGLACGDDDSLYISVNKPIEHVEARMMWSDMSHIHQYSFKGRFMACIFKGLHALHGITWHNGSLYVADTTSVRILGKSSSS